MLWMPNLQINLRKQLNKFMEENPSGLFKILLLSQLHVACS